MSTFSAGAGGAGASAAKRPMESTQDHGTICISSRHERVFRASSHQTGQALRVVERGERVADPHQLRVESRREYLQKQYETPDKQTAAELSETGGEDDAERFLLRVTPGQRHLPGWTCTCRCSPSTRSFSAALFALMPHQPSSPQATNSIGNYLFLEAFTVGRLPEVDAQKGTSSPLGQDLGDFCRNFRSKDSARQPAQLH